MKELAIEKIELLLNDLKINHNKEQEEKKDGDYALNTLKDIWKYDPARFHMLEQYQCAGNQS